MRHTTIHTLGTVLLLGVFACFTVGIPVVRYMCPLMSDEQPVCPMSTHQEGPGASLTTPTPDCCGQVIVAERNTTPYVNGSWSLTSLIDHPALLHAVLTPDAIVPTLFTSTPVAPPARSGSSDPPLFLLHSSLLI